MKEFFTSSGFWAAVIFISVLFLLPVLIYTWVKWLTFINGVFW